LHSRKERENVRAARPDPSATITLSPQDDKASADGRGRPSPHEIGKDQKDWTMPVTKARKKEQVEKLSADLKNVSSAVVATYSKMTVAQDYELRKALRGAGAKYQVVKNTLAELAAKGTKIEEGLKNLTGVTSIAYTTGDPVAMAKALTKYAKDTPEFTFKVGVVEGRVISIKEIEALASMPSKEEIYSKLLFLISSPAQRLVTVMNAVGRDVAVVLSQGVEKGKFKEA
jgi:large subunit ribosomal protein L10